MRIVGMLLALLAIQSPVAESEVYESHQAATEAVDRYDLQARVDQFLALSHVVPADHLSDAIQGFSRDETLPLILRERVVFEFAYQLRNELPDSQLWSVLEQLKHTAPKVFIPNEHRTTQLIPAFPVATAAAGTQNVWIYEVSRQNAMSAFHTGDIEFLRSQVSPDAHRQQRTGVAAAAQTLSAADITTARPMLEQLLSEPGFAAAGISLAKTLPADWIVDPVLLHGEPSLRQRFWIELNDYVGTERAHEKRVAAVNSDVVQDRAVIFASLADNRKSFKANQEFIVQALDDSSLSATAALLIAEYGEADLIPVLAQHADKGSVQLSMSKHILRSMNLPEADIVLQDLSAGVQR